MQPGQRLYNDVTLEGYPLRSDCLQTKYGTSKGLYIALFGKGINVIEVSFSAKH